MTLTGEETVFYLARKNTTNNEDSVLRLNTYSGLFSQSNDFEGASKYATFEDASKLVTLHNAMAELTGQAYEYYVIEHNVNSFRLDAEGNRAPDEVQPDGRASSEDEEEVESTE